MEDMLQGIRKGTAHGSTADDEAGVGGTAAKKAPAHGQLCGRSAGGGVRLGLVENYSAFTGADQKTRRFKHHKAGIIPGPPAKGNTVVLADILQRATSLCVPSEACASSYLRDVSNELESHGERERGPRARLVDNQGDPQYASFRLARTTRLRSLWCQETVGQGVF